MTEHEIHAAIVEWATWQANQHPVLNMLVHVPNEGKRSWYYGKKLKAQGMRKGFPDLFLFVPRRGFHGLAIEVKTKSGKLRKEQNEFLEELRFYGYGTVIVRSVEEGIKILKEYLNLGGMKN